MSRSSHRRCSIKKVFLKLDEMGVRYNYALYLFVSFWYYYYIINIILLLYYSIQKQSNGSVPLFLKISQNSQGNTCTGVSFLSAVSNFINEETPVQCFLKLLTIFAESSIVDV